MDLPLPTPKTDDIYSLGFSPNLSRPIPNEATGVVYDSINDTQNTASLLSGGNLNLKTLSIGGLVKQVAPGDDIQAAIDAVNREGGGTVQLFAKTYSVTGNLYLKSNVALMGAGRDLTILEFNNSVFGLMVQGFDDSSSLIPSINNFLISGLTIQNSNSSYGLSIQYAKYFRLENVRVTSCSQAGIEVSYSKYFSCLNLFSDNNSTNGYTLSGNKANAFNENVEEHFSFENCIAKSNGSVGFLLQPGGSTSLANFTFINCTSILNTSHGYQFDDTSGSSLDFTLIGCNSQENLGTGYTIGAVTGRGLFSGCQADTNTGNGFEIAGNRLKFIGCFSDQNAVDWNVTTTSASENIFIGCEMKRGATSVPNLRFVETDSYSFMWGNIGSSTRTQKQVLQTKNNSGGTVPAGAVVAFDSVANGDNVTTTTTNGNSKVFGMILSSISNGQYGPCVKEGFTTLLYATNGTSSLAIGDFLSTYSHAYYAKKAVAGDTAFAVCMEAPTTSTAIIDALLISPRLI